MSSGLERSVILLFKVLSLADQKVYLSRMPPKVYIAENEIMRAFGSNWQQSQNSIARHFGKSKSVISRMEVKIMGGSGRPKKTSASTYRCVKKPVRFYSVRHQNRRIHSDLTF